MSSIISHLISIIIYLLNFNYYKKLTQKNLDIQKQRKNSKKNKQILGLNKMSDSDKSNKTVSFHLMAKPNGPQCNLNCKYCFYSPKKDLYPDKSLKMSDEVLEEYTRQYISAVKIPEVTFSWQGGEPTLRGLDFFKKAIEFQKKYRKPGMQIYNTIQTNGTLLNEEWCGFFRENNFLVGISVDGPKNLHDRYRQDKKGNSTFQRVIESIKLLNRCGVEFNILSTVNRINADHPLEVYRFFRDTLGAKHIQFIPVVEFKNNNDGVELSNESVLHDQYGKFLTAIFDDWVRNDVGNVYINIFDASLVSWVNHPPSVCLFSPQCGTALVIEYNGDVYSCDHFVDMEHLLGNIMETPLEKLVDSPKQTGFGSDKLDKLSKQCSICNYKFACWGACPKHRFIKNDVNQKDDLNYLCPSYTEYFKHIDWSMTIMTALYNQGKAPADIMAIINQNNRNLQEIFPEVGRNDLCPCNSGKKFKKCHGRNN